MQKRLQYLRFVLYVKIKLFLHEIFFGTCKFKELTKVAVDGALPWYIVLSGIYLGSLDGILHALCRHRLVTAWSNDIATVADGFLILTSDDACHGQMVHDIAQPGCFDTLDRCRQASVKECLQVLRCKILEDIMGNKAIVQELECLVRETASKAVGMMTYDVIDIGHVRGCAAFMVQLITELRKGFIGDRDIKILLHQCLTLGEQIHQVAIRFLMAFPGMTAELLGELAVNLGIPYKEVV